MTCHACPEKSARIVRLEALLEAERAQARRVREKLAVLTGKVAVVLDAIESHQRKRSRHV